MVHRAASQPVPHLSAICNTCFLQPVLSALPVVSTELAECVMIEVVNVILIDYYITCVDRQRPYIDSGALVVRTYRNVTEGVVIAAVLFVREA